LTPTWNYVETRGEHDTFNAGRPSAGRIERRTPAREAHAKRGHVRIKPLCPRGTVSRPLLTAIRPCGTERSHVCPSSELDGHMLLTLGSMMSPPRSPADVSNAGESILECFRIRPCGVLIGILVLERHSLHWQTCEKVMGGMARARWRKGEEAKLPVTPVPFCGRKRSSAFARPQ